MSLLRGFASRSRERVRDLHDARYVDRGSVHPSAATLRKLQEAAAGCTACDLYKVGTQTVFGDGPRSAEVMLVGEQPGDKEDLAGEPFIGPAGRLLDQALVTAGIDRKPTALVCLGSTAAQALLGKQFRVTKQRGEFVDSDLAELVTATVHPSSILRGEREEREAALQELADDLAKVARALSDR